MTISISKYKLSKQQHTIALDYTLGENENLTDLYAYDFQQFFGTLECGLYEMVLLLSNQAHLIKFFFLTFVSCEQINYLPMPKAEENIIDLRGLEKSRYFSKTEFNNDFIIQPLILFFTTFNYIFKMARIERSTRFLFKANAADICPELIKTLIFCAKITMYNPVLAIKIG